MKALILAGGYGTRLQRDLENDSSGQFSGLIGVSKALLPIGSVLLVSRIVKLITSAMETTDCLVVTNEVHLKAFQDWAKDWPGVNILSDGSTCNDNRLGGVGTIQHAVRETHIEDDLLIIAGDTLLFDDFSLTSFVETFSERLLKDNTSSLVVTCQCSDEDTWKRGVVEINSDGKVLRFLEKVGPEKTSSRLAVPCFYLLSRSALQVMDQFLDERKGQPLSQRDAPGHFIKYLSERLPVYTYTVSGRFDVGSLELYKECNEYFLSRELKRDVNDS